MHNYVSHSDLLLSSSALATSNLLFFFTAVVSQSNNYKRLINQDIGVREKLKSYLLFWSSRREATK